MCYVAIIPSADQGRNRYGCSASAGEARLKRSACPRLHRLSIPARVEAGIVPAEVLPVLG
jgi:hypothetical protein